ncbi:unnamed protein product [Bubo scandiacus]
MQMEGAGRGRRDSEPRKSGETPYKNYWGPFPGRTTKAPETAAARGGGERGGAARRGAERSGAGRPLPRRGRRERRRRRLCRRGGRGAPGGQ